jgi:hypothetical protein
MKAQLYTDQIDIVPSAAALAAIDQALDTIEANADFLHSIPSEKRMVLRGLSYCNNGFAIDALEIGIQNEARTPFTDGRRTQISRRELTR